VEKEVVDLVETESIKFCLGGWKIKVENVPRGLIKDIFASVAHSRSRLSCKKRSNAKL
jgi:hypothetical protein